jgi:hypothetical protein
MPVSDAYTDSMQLRERSQYRNDVYVIASNWFVNRCPLVCRIPRLPVGSTTFTLMSRRPDGTTASVPQHCQEWSIAAMPARHGTPRVRPSGGPPREPFDAHRMDALQDLVDEMETDSYYGEGVDPVIGFPPRQKGLRTLLITNRVTSPANAGAYRPADFLRDTLQACRDKGGDPDVLLVASNFLTGFATWGLAFRRIDAGVNLFGVPIAVFEAPFLGGVSVVEAPLLKPFTAVCLTSAQVRMRMVRNEFWRPSGDLGAAMEGHWVAEGAVEVEDEHHHAWVEGIAAFAA